MELFAARDHFILQNGEHSLWCSRFDGSLLARRGEDLCQAWNPVCLGQVHGVIGKIKIHPDTEWRLLLISKRALVGSLPGNMDVYCITKIAVLPLCLEEPKDLDIELCSKHHFGISKAVRNAKGPDSQQRALQKTWNSIKSAAETVKPKKLPFKMPTAGEAKAQQQQKDLKEREKFERRILEEVIKMFTDSESFYYCPAGDLTHTIQRQRLLQNTLYLQPDDRFFWNKNMLQDLVDIQDPLVKPWIVPIVQGYVQIETCTLTFSDDLPSPDAAEDGGSTGVDYKMCIVSRRSRHRAGTRYRRRGVDGDGFCANYVETEQILQFTNHTVSFVQVRGSVPLYWSQTGIKYKPPPRIEKGDAENQSAFAAHFKAQAELYRRVAVVNLVDQSGKEKVIADTFLNHILQLNSPDLTYVAFDFHEYCRGMRFENVGILTENIADIIKHMRYCWVDANGMICDQRGVFRVNCIDCLDRTNIVQSAIARLVLEIQCRKLGLLPPDEQLPDSARLLYQQMWANNGDVISRQYAGTAALKGDFTRTGERKLTGMMKDGVNSANRYYINRVKDGYRQAAIDLMLGNAVSEDLRNLTSNRPEPEEDSQMALVEKEENMKTLIDECKKMLITEPEECLGGWGLIDADPVTGDPTQQDMDVVLLLTQRAYYVASYDDEADEVSSYEKVLLEDVEGMEIGPAPALFKSKHVCLRIYYQKDGETGYFHMLRTTNTRLFNNLVIVIKNEEEAKESLRAIYESFAAAKKLASQELAMTDCKLDRRRSKPHMDIINIASQAQEQVNILPAGAANISSRRKVKQAPLSKPGAKLNISRLGRSFLSPVKKIGLSSRLRLRPQISRFVPAVWYSKDSENAEEAQNNSESARILKGEKIVADSFVDGKPITDQKKLQTLQRDYSLDDIESILVSDSDSDVSSLGDTELFDSELFLESCGILANRFVAQPSPLVSRPHRQQTEVPEATETSSADNSTQLPSLIDLKKKSLLMAHLKSRSLDTDFKTDRRPKSMEFLQGTQTNFFLGPAEVQKSEDSESPTACAKDSVDSVGASDTVNRAADTTATKDDLDTVSTSDKLDKTVASDNSDRAASENTDGDVKLGSDITGDITGEAKTSPEDQNSSSKPVQLYHPCMKMSFSEGSLAAAYHSDLDASSIVPSEDKADNNMASSSAFSRFRVKMSNLARDLPSMPSQQDKQQAARTTARQNRLKSELQYEQCQTRIILL